MFGMCEAVRGLEEIQNSGNGHIIEKALPDVGTARADERFLSQFEGTVRRDGLVGICDDFGCVNEPNGSLGEPSCADRAACASA
jgi:hypothetical protein